MKAFVVIFALLIASVYSGRIVHVRYIGDEDYDTKGLTNDEDQVDDTDDFFNNAAKTAADAFDNAGTAAKGFIEAPSEIAKGLVGTAAKTTGGFVKATGNVASKISGGFQKGLKGLFANFAK